VRLLADEALGDMDPENDLIKISASWAGVRKIPSGYDQTVPGYLVMFVMMSTLIYGAAGLASERKTGMIARLGTAPLSHGELILGKLAGRTLIAVAQVAIFLLMGFTLFRIDWGDSPAGLAAVLGSLVLCAGSFGLLAGTLFRSPEAAGGIGVVMSLVMSALGGCWWPVEVMPRWLQTAAHVFPTTWAMDGLHQVISWGGGLGDVAVIAAVLTLFALGASSLAVYRLNPAD
jgi:ABC-type multidrug transport system permease subunit